MVQKKQTKIRNYIHVFLYFDMEDKRKDWCVWKIRFGKDYDVSKFKFQFLYDFLILSYVDCYTINSIHKS